MLAASTGWPVPEMIFRLLEDSEVMQISGRGRLVVERGFGRMEHGMKGWRNLNPGRLQCGNSGVCGG